MNKARKLLALLLCLVMVVGMFPTAYAEGEGGEISGPVEEIIPDTQEEDPIEPEEDGLPDEESGTIAPADGEDVIGENEAIPEEGQDDETEPGEDDEEEPEPPQVTRIQWISFLVSTFSMTVDANNYPDNYYSDMSAGDPGYRDLMVAVEFGVVDLDAGLPFRPDEAATRDFAAQTLTYCLGFQEPEETAYSYSDEVPHPWAAQVALNRGWFAAVEGEFLPEEPITADERDVMLADAAAILASDVIDLDHVNSNGFAEGVVVIPMGTDITNDDAGRLHIHAADAAIEAGTVFVIYYGDFPMAFVATEVEADGEWLIVTATTEGAEDAITDLDYAGSLSADIKRFVPAGESVVWADDGDMIYNMPTVVEPNGSGITITKTAIKGSQKIGIDDGLKAVISYNIKDISVDAVIDKKNNSYKVVIDSDATLDVSVKWTESAENNAYGYTTKVPIGYVPFLYGAGDIDIYFEYDFGGQMGMSINGDLCIGFSYNESEGFRLIQSFQKKQFSISANCFAQAGVYMDAGIDLWVLKCGIHGGFGVKTEYRDALYGVGEPERCQDLSAYLYALAGANAKIFGIKEFKTGDKYLYDKNNSPIRLHYHWEDYARVAECTREQDFKEETGSSPGGYYTGSGSRYYDPMSLHASSSYVNDKGQTVTLWTYTLNDSNQATITKYKGSASTVQVPETIDGYTVVAVGTQAFYQNKTVRTVMIADTVTSIGSYAFYQCTSLSAISLSQNLKTISTYAFSGCTALGYIELPDSLVSIDSYAFSGCTSLETVICGDAAASVGDYAFQNCTSLTSVTLPGKLTSLSSKVFYGCTSLKEITIPASLNSCYGSSEVKNDRLNLYYHNSSNEYGPFTGSSLEIIVLEEGLTDIPACLFANCDTVKTIILPSSLHVIGDAAFVDCEKLCVVVVPENVETIGTGAFLGCTSLKSIELPDSVTVIGTAAFALCDHLEKVRLPGGLTKLNGVMFYGCTNLREIQIPKSISNVNTFAFGQYATIYSSYPFNHAGNYGVFEGCTDLSELSFEEGTTRIPAYLFYNCSGLGDLIIPNTITDIENYAFQKATGLTSVSMGDVVATIGDYAFEGCINLKTVLCGEAAASIGNYAFSGCAVLTTITLPGKLTSLGYEVFSGCSSLKEITIPATISSCNGHSYASGKDRDLNYYYPNNSNNEYGPFTNSSLSIIVLEDGMETIPDYMFTNCDSIEEVTIPESVLAIGYAAFADCKNLVRVSIPEGLERIEFGAFLGCTSLEQINLPDSVNYLGSAAFALCSNLKTVRLPKNLSVLSGAMFFGCSHLRSIVIPKSMTFNRYQISRYATVWSTYPFYHVGYYGTFEGCSDLSELSFEDGRTVIPSYMFYNCPGLGNLVIPSTVTEIQSYAFQNATGLQHVTIGRAVTTIGDSAFSGAGLVDLTIPANVRTVGDSAFSSCASLESLTVASVKTALGSSCFKDCSALTDVSLPEGLTTMGSSWFQNCSSLESFTIPDTVTAINASCFYGCTSLTDIPLPAGLQTIGTSAFQDCDSLTVVTIPEGVKTIGASAYRDCDALTDVSIPNSVTSLGDYLFYHCDELVNVHLGNGAATIPQYSFYLCPKLAEIVIPRGVTTIKPYAFNSSTGLVKVTLPRTVTSIDVTSFSYPEWTVIYGIAGTYAETWANENGFTFVDEQTHADQVSLGEKAIILNKGYSVFIPLLIDPADVTDEVIWKVSNSTAIKIDGDYTGVTVTGLDFGTSTVKVNVGTKGASCKITVVQPVTSLKLDKTTLGLDALEEVQLTATVLPADAYNNKILWSSSDDEVATVDENGLVTAHAKGTAVIIAFAADGSGKQAACNVTVRNTAYVVDNPEELESPHNYEDYCSDVWSYCMPGAEKLLVSFDERTEIEEDFDFLYLYDGEGNEIGVYTGAELAGQTIEIPGDTVRIRLISDDSGNEWGFKVSGVEAVMPAPTYEITYDANGGTGAPASQAKIHDADLTLSDVKPTRENEAAGSYTVTLDANGGSVDPEALTAERTMSFQFQNWNTAADGSGTTYVPGANYTANEAMTLYAQWSSSTSAKPVTLPVPTRSGYVFRGWATSASAEGGVKGRYTPEDDVTLYATWVAVADSPTFHIEEVRGTAGKQVEIPIRIENNPGIFAMTVSFSYDTSALRLIAVTPNTEVFSGSWQTASLKGATWASDTGDVFANDTILILTFEVLEDAEDGDYAVSVTPNEIVNEAMEDIEFVSVSGKVTVTSHVPGDVNGDGKVSTKDFVTLMKYLSGEDVAVDESALDINGDGKVSTKDFVLLMKYLSGEDVTIY